MAFICNDVFAGAQPLTVTDTVKNHNLGKIISGADPVYGEGKFIYLQGIGSTGIGDGVVYDSAFLTTRSVAASRGQFAVALSANVASQYGWYQIQGLAVVKAATVVSGTAAQLTATPGTLDDTATATNYIDGAVFKTADGTPAATFAILDMSYPSANGR